MNWLERLDAVQSRLDALAARDLHGLTAPDDATGERWDPGQVWAHLAEFGDYWLDELEQVLAGAPEFGRTKSDPRRIAAIEDGRHRPTSESVRAMRLSMARLRTRLQAMSEADWHKTARHPTLGDMTIDDQMQHFHVGHYEEHADQLESLT
jgi:hypothetical protein